jgi:uncharacterized protein (TIGR02996 family)
MGDDAALLQAIREAPDDDAPRLVYADWLDEHGAPERAEFIRVCVELIRVRQAAAAARGLDRGLAARLDQLEDRKADVFYRRRPAAVGPYPAGWRCLLAPPARDDPSYARRHTAGAIFLARGLGELVVAQADKWVARGDQILAAHPVREVRLAGEPAAVGLGGRRGVRGDPARRRFTAAAVDAAGRPGEPPVAGLLRCRWPAVKTWQFFPAPDPA